MAGKETAEVELTGSPGRRLPLHCVGTGHTHVPQAYCNTSLMADLDSVAAPSGEGSCSNLSSNRELFKVITILRSLDRVSC